MGKEVSLKVLQVVRSLKRHGFGAIAVRDRDRAGQVILEKVPRGATAGLSDSATLKQLGIDEFLTKRGITVINPYGKQALKELEEGLVTREQRISLVRSTLLSDVFIAGSNAITEDGKIVNIDGAGNRVAGMIFGPSRVFIVVGSNKIVHDVDDALYRIKNVIAPFHAKHKQYDVPCLKTGRCLDCNSPDRLCRIVVVLERQPIYGDICIVIVDDDLGLGWDTSWPQERINAIQKAYIEVGVLKPPPWQK